MALVNKGSETVFLCECEVCLMFGSTSSNEKQLEDAICAVKSASKLFYMGSLTQTAIPVKSLMKLNMEFGPVNI